MNRTKLIASCRVVRSYYPLHVAAGTPLAARRKIRGGAPQVLADPGFPEQHFEDRISVRQPTTEEVESLDLPPDVPVFRQFRVVYSDSGRSVEAQAHEPHACYEVIGIASEGCGDRQVPAWGVWGPAPTGGCPSSPSREARPRARTSLFAPGAPVRGQRRSS
ncbi:UTRA domain-containing protein [Nonomuraea sp. NPDC003709]|uniref:UTRA domain-containing protein n=1 Tax=Nonomuraea sp. NPDC003709 TaxID=3154450 RepID=UPI0033BE7E67